MSNFFETDDGFVNLDRVATVTVNRAGNLLFRDAGGHTIATAHDIRGDLEDFLSPIIPARPTDTATVVTVDDIGHRPTEADVFVSDYPIVAWRVSRAGAVPVFPTEIAANDRVLLRAPHGLLIEPFNCEYENLDHAKRAILAERQRQWDRDHASAGPA